MNIRTILLGTAACALFAVPALGQDTSTPAPPKHHHHADSVQERLDRMERLIEEQQAEIRELKGERGTSGGAGSGGTTTAAAAPAPQPEVSAAQFEALQNQVYEEAAARKSLPTVTMSKGHVTLASPDGKWTFSPLLDVMGDWAAYDPGKSGVATSKVLKQSGENIRRAQIGFGGKLAGDFPYKFLADFGGTNGDETYQAYYKDTKGTLTSTGAGTGPHIKEAWVGYKGILDPVTFKVGAMPTPANLSDMTASDDLLFNERPSPAQIDRGIAADDGRESVGFIGNGSWWYGSAFLTGDTYAKADVLAPGSGQEAIVGRAAIAPWYDPDTNFNIHLGGNVTDVIHPQDTTSCSLGATSCTTVAGISLSDRPELRVDNVTFLKTPTFNATGATAYGVEGAASWGPLMVEGENFWYNVDLVPTAGKTNPNFSGWYIEGSWVITGEPHKYNMATASYLRPSPDNPVGSGGWGAFEVAGRYSSTDLEYHTGLADAVYGGKQNILSTGLNWYPIDAVKVMFDYEMVSLRDIGGLTTNTTDDNGHFTDLSTRVQISF
jgi:phosphate-selective porin OprO/OprP